MSSHFIYTQMCVCDVFVGLYMCKYMRVCYVVALYIYADVCMWCICGCVCMCLYESPSCPRTLSGGAIRNARDNAVMAKKEKRRIYTCISVWKCVCMYTGGSICVFVYMTVHVVVALYGGRDMCICMYTHIYIYVEIYVPIYISYIYIYIYIYKYILTYLHIYVYIYICLPCPQFCQEKDDSWWFRCGYIALPADP